MKCLNCADWEPEIAKVNAPIMLQSARAGRNTYFGKPFVYCPWCGSSLEDDAPLEMTNTPIDRATVEMINKWMKPKQAVGSCCTYIHSCLFDSDLDRHFGRS